MRECLNDVFDLPGLTGLMREMGNRETRVVEAATAQPSPFARSLLFGYVGAFMYEGDAPLAEQRAQALALDTTLLAELLAAPSRAARAARPERAGGNPSTAPISDHDDERRVSTVDGVADLLRLLGGLTEAEIQERGGRLEWLAELEKTRRAIQVRIGGEHRWIAIEDAGRVRDALGAALPVGVPDVFTEPVADPLGDLVSRFARTHGPFSSHHVAERFGIGIAIAASALHRLASAGRVVAGEFTPGGSGAEWCDTEVLRTLRRRSLAVLRAEVEPVPAAALGTFFASLAAHRPAPAEQRRGRHAGRRDRRPAGRAAAGECAGAADLAGPGAALLLPPALLDELCASGEVLWAGNGSLPGNDGWVALSFADTAPLLLPEPLALAEGPVPAAVIECLAGGQALFFRDISDRVGTALGSPVADDDLVAAIWELVWAGAASATTRSARCAPCSAPAVRATDRPPAPPGRVFGEPNAGLGCPPGPARRRLAAGGACCPTANPTRPCARMRPRTRCWSDMACSPGDR